MLFDLIMFDLDNTLVKTDDLEKSFRGVMHTGIQNKQYSENLVAAIRSKKDRKIYSDSIFHKIKFLKPKTAIGIFTKAPREYTRTILHELFDFDFWPIISYEDVPRGLLKPHPEALFQAMKMAGVTDSRKVLTIGDRQDDVLAAYRAGTWIFVEISSWSSQWTPENYQTVDRIPDAIIQGEDELLHAIQYPYGQLPLLEKIRAGADTKCEKFPIRSDTVIFDDALNSENHASVVVLGRMFTQHPGLDLRRKWNPVSGDILELKSAEKFPDAWLTTINLIIKDLLSGDGEGGFTVTVIPAKPGRYPRLEGLLHQISQKHQNSSVKYTPDILEFGPNAISSHGNHLSRRERFLNIRNNLRIKKPSEVNGELIVVIDDVVTSGATLLYAQTALLKAGARGVLCLALTKTISNR